MSPWIYILIGALVTYLIRVLPLTLIRRPINNRFVKSFLYYVPYVTLAVMTFPAILHVSDDFVVGLLPLIVGIVSAWVGANLFQVAILCSAVALGVLYLF